MVQAGLFKRIVTKEFNSRGWLASGNIRCNIFFLQKKEYVLILSLFNVDSRIGSVIDFCFIVGITIGCDIELKYVVDLATNDRIAFFYS